VPVQLIAQKTRLPNYLHALSVGLVWLVKVNYLRILSSMKSGAICIFVAYACAAGGMSVTCSIICVQLEQNC